MLLGRLRRFEADAGAREICTRILEVVVEKEAVEIAREIVVMRHVAARPVTAIALRVAPALVQVRQTARGNSHQVAKRPSLDREPAIHIGFTNRTRDDVSAADPGAL